METIITIFLNVLALYFSIGILFGLYFLVLGATKIDPLMGNSKKGVRVLVFPGVVATWPFLLSKLLKSKR